MREDFAAFLTEVQKVEEDLRMYETLCIVANPFRHDDDPGYAFQLVCRKHDATGTTYDHVFFVAHDEAQELCRLGIAHDLHDLVVRSVNEEKKSEEEWLISKLIKEKPWKP